MEKLDKKEKLEKLKEKIKYYRGKRNETIATNVLKGTIIASPFLIAGLLLGGHFIKHKNIPGHIDYLERHANNTITYSSDTGLLEKNTEYVISDQNHKDKMTYYGPWVQQADGTYTSSVKEYILNDIGEKEINELVNKENLAFEDIFNLSVDGCTDRLYRKDSLTQEELEMEPHFEITVFDVDKNDTMMVRETPEENKDDIAIVVLGVFAAILCEGVILMIAGPYSSLYDFESTRGYSMDIKNYKKEIKELKKTK
ncbi:MAG: hypothetical protein IK137_02710 [Bacilli bacterium]|nr:hypothetical protein [Bacilli bacterium]